MTEQCSTLFFFRWFEVKRLAWVYWAAIKLSRNPIEKRHFAPENCWFQRRWAGFKHHLYLEVHLKLVASFIFVGALELGYLDLLDLLM